MAQDMQESRVRFLPYQELPAADLNDLQGGPQLSLDAVVKEALGIENAFTGLACTTSGATDVAVAPGRYWKSGIRYRHHETTTIALLQHLPTVGLKRMVSIGVHGVQVDIDSDIRRFLVDSTPGQITYEPRPTDTRIRRLAQFQLFVGVQGTAAVPPTVDPDHLEIARVTLSETGIVGQPEMMVANMLRSMGALASLLDTLIAAFERIEGELASLRSDLAALSALLERKADRSELMALSRNLMRVMERLDVPENRIGHGYDNFNSVSETDQAHADYDAYIDWGGLRFPQEAAVNVPPALLNPVDPKVSVSAGGLVLPVHTSVVRLENKGAGQSLAPLDATQGTFEFTRLEQGQVFMHYGPAIAAYGVTPELHMENVVRLYDPIEDEFVTVNLREARWRIESIFESREFTRVRLSDPYPGLYTTDTQVTGAAVAQTFLNSRVGWLKRIDVAVKTKAASGTIHAFLCRVQPGGEPDLGRCLAIGSVAQANINQWPAWTPIEIEPTLLEAGKRYAVVLVTAGAHVLGATQDRRSMHGALFHALDGTHFTAVQDRDLTIRMAFAEFANPRYVVDLQGLQLAGGIGNLDSFLTGYEPDGTALVIQGQIAGVWRNLDSTDLTALNARPNLIALRAVFKGTEFVMPGVNFGKSRLVGFVYKEEFTHVSSVRALASAAGNVKVRLKLQDFDADIHDIAVTLLTGEDFDTEEAAVSEAFEADIQDDDGKRILAFKFEPDPSIDEYKIKIVGATSESQSMFVVRARSDVATA